MLYEATTTEPGFRELFRGSEHRQALCVLTIVAWVACCDGKVSPREQELLRNTAEGYEGTDREMAAAMENFSTEDRLTTLLAVSAKLVLENLVLHLQLMRRHGLPVSDSVEDLLSRLRKGPPNE